MRLAKIYTIGYEGLSIELVEQYVRALKAKLIDCRFKPRSRNPIWNGNRLAERFGALYEWRGAELGGFGHTTDAGIKHLRATKSRVLLLCMEHCPGDCHRHSAICAPYFPNAVHIFEDELIKASELQSAIVHDECYSTIGSSEDLLALALNTA